MFSTRNGLYQRACRRFGITDGKKLFSWRFYDKQRPDVTSFFVDIHKEAVKAHAGPGHVAVADLERGSKLLRHYTMNVDGLASHVRIRFLLLLTSGMLDCDLTPAVDQVRMSIGTPGTNALQVFVSGSVKSARPTIALGICQDAASRVWPGIMLRAHYMERVCAVWHDHMAS